MTNLPEPAGHRDLRVSDADRERAAEALRIAAGDGRITFEELDERLSSAYAARTYGELAVVTADLPGPGRPAPGALPDSPAPFPAGRIGGSPGAGASVAVLSGVERKGPWVVPPEHTAVAILGGIQLDLREARFSQAEVTIRAFTFMGGIDVIVPEDIEVEISGFGFMGAVDHQASGPGAPGSPRVKVVGCACMGAVSVQRKPPRQAKKPKLGSQPPGEIGGGPPPASD